MSEFLKNMNCPWIMNSYSNSVHFHFSNNYYQPKEICSRAPRAPKTMYTDLKHVIKSHCLRPATTKEAWRTTTTEKPASSQLRLLWGHHISSPPCIKGLLASTAGPSQYNHVQHLKRLGFFYRCHSLIQLYYCGWPHPTLSFFAYFCPPFHCDRLVGWAGASTIFRHLYLWICNWWLKTGNFMKYLVLIS